MVKDENRKRVLIAMSNTGGGHKASAEAIKDAFLERYGNKYEVCMYGGIVRPASHRIGGFTQREFGLASHFSRLLVLSVIREYPML